MYRKYVRAIAAAAALALCSAGNTLAQTAAGGVTYNTDLKLTRQSTVTIIDQQSPYLDGNGDPIFDSNGNEETIDITSVNLDLFLTYGDFKSDLTEGITNDNILSVAVQPAGFCAANSAPASPTPAPALKSFVTTEPFLIPLGQLRNGPGFGPFLSTYLFEGQTENFLAYFGVPLAAARAAELGSPAPTQGPIPPADSQEGYEGVPFANMTLTLALPNVGEVKLDGITDVSRVLGVPQGKVDLVVTYGEANPDSDNPGAPSSGGVFGSPEVIEGACLPNVTPTVVIVPVPQQDGLISN
jgi:hypothetical protein